MLPLRTLMLPPMRPGATTASPCATTASPGATTAEAGTRAPQQMLQSRVPLYLMSMGATMHVHVHVHLHVHVHVHVHVRVHVLARCHEMP